MSLDRAELAGSFRKMRKSLSAARSDISSGTVHRLRTNARRLDTFINALGLNERAGGERLLSMIASHRKKAGKVRDLDVQIRLVAGLANHDDDGNAVQLLAHIGARRQRSARKLRSLIENHQKDLRRALKQNEDYVRRHLAADKRQGKKKATKWGKKCQATAHELTSSMVNGPRLNAANLHAFRLQVKQLRALLTLKRRPDSGLLDMLSATKDAVGDWNDWRLLNDLANKLSDRPSALQQRITSQVQSKLVRALRVAGQLKQHRLQALVDF
jgi:CHAD domain-containing protein